MYYSRSKTFCNRTLQTKVDSILSEPALSLNGAAESSGRAIDVSIFYLRTHFIFEFLVKSPLTTIVNQSWMFSYKSTKFELIVAIFSVVVQKETKKSGIPVHVSQNLKQKSLSCHQSRLPKIRQQFSSARKA